MKKHLLIFNYICLVSFCTFFLYLGINAQIPTNGLVACYPFDGNVSDMSGNNHNGTLYGATLTTDRFGRPNCAYSFNGYSNYVSLPSSSFILQNFSYSVWAYTNAYPASNGYGTLISIGSYGGDNNIGLGNSYASGAIGWTFGSYSAPGNVPGWWQGTLPPLNTWFHLTITRDANYLKCYINGQLGYSLQISGTTPYYGSGTILANIGQRSVMSVNQYFNGKIDDIHIYNRALTPREVRNLYKGECHAVIILPHPSWIVWTGTNVTFTAYTNNTISNPSYQWRVNGINVGENASTYSTTDLNTGDIVRCIVFSSDGCEVPFLSNPILMIVIPFSYIPDVTQNGLTLTSSLAEGNQWYFNGNIIPGAINQSYTCAENGSYTVNINLDGHSSLPSAPIVIDNVKTDEYYINKSLTVFPNPNNGIYTISFNSDIITSYKIEITNSLGQEVYNETINEFKGTYSKQINVSEYGKGVYILSLISNNYKITKKIIVY